MLNGVHTTSYDYSSVNNISDQYENSNYSFLYNTDENALYSTPSNEYGSNITK